MARWSKRGDRCTVSLVPAPRTDDGGQAGSGWVGPLEFFLEEERLYQATKSPVGEGSTGAGPGWRRMLRRERLGLSCRRAASLFFSLISSRYEQNSLIVSSNKSFSGWAEIFRDAVAVEAMVDRLVHHSEIIVLKGDSHRLKGEHKR